MNADTPMNPRNRRHGLVARVTSWLPCNAGYQPVLHFSYPRSSAFIGG
jgi:hypothetical protein